MTAAINKSDADNALKGDQERVQRDHLAYRCAGCAHRAGKMVFGRRERASKFWRERSVRPEAATKLQSARAERAGRLSVRFDGADECSGSRLRQQPEARGYLVQERRQDYGRYTLAQNEF
jgi:hypothetical protein